jgi:AcrR family transcriptional regulator
VHGHGHAARVEATANLRRVRATKAPWERGNAGGRATRELIIRTAERLFAERGIDAVSLREIGIAAGQRNNGATQYHFGDRDSLVRAIFIYRSVENNRRRQELLDAIIRDGRERDTAALVEAIVRPSAEQVSEDNRYMGFLARLEVERGQAWLTDPREAPQGTESDAYVEVRRLLRDALPQLSDAAFLRRLAMITSWLVLTIANYERALLGRESQAQPLDELIGELVFVLSAVLEASETREPEAASRRGRPGGG